MAESTRIEVFQVPALIYFKLYVSTFCVKTNMIFYLKCWLLNDRVAQDADAVVEGEEKQESIEVRFH